MGRFYQTTDPKFIDYVFQPNLDLKLALAEQEVKNSMLKQQLLQETPDVNINHLNFEAENERVKELQDKYMTGVENIAKNIYDGTGDNTKHLVAMKELQREMLQDKSAGDWYKIEQRYKDYSGWLKNHEKIKEKDPGLFNRLNNHWLTTLETEATENPDTRFKGQQIVERPEIVNSLREEFENVKANVATYKNGKYFIKDKQITENEMAEIALHNLLSRPNYQGYVNQMGNVLGDSNYNQPFFELMSKKGETISFEEFSKLSEEAKKEYNKVLNNKNPFYNDLASVARTYSFSEREIEEDKFDLQNDKYINDKNLANDAYKYNINLEKQKQVGRENIERMEQTGRERLADITYKNNYKLAEAKGEIKNGEITVLQKENFQLFSKEQLQENQELIFDVLRRVGDSDPKNNPTAQEIAQAKQLQAIFESAAEENKIPEKLAYDLAKVNDENWGWNYVKVATMGPDGRDYTYKKIITQERVAAEKFIAENKEKYENFNKKLLENSGYSVPAINIGGDDPVSKAFKGEFNNALNGTNYTPLSPNLLPYKTSLGNIPQNNPLSVEGKKGAQNIDFINDIANKNGVLPSEIFESDLKRIKIGGELFYKGTIKKDMLAGADPRWFGFTSANLENPSTQKSEGATVLIKLDDVATTGDNYLMEKFKDNPGMREAVQMGNDKYYADISTNTNKAILNIDSGQKHFATALPTSNKLVEFGKDDLGYYLIIDGKRVSSSTTNKEELIKAQMDIAKGKVKLK